MPGRRLAEFVAEVLEVGKSYRGASGSFVDLRIKNATDRPIITLPTSEETTRVLGQLLYRNVYLALEAPGDYESAQEVSPEQAAAQLKLFFASEASIGGAAKVAILRAALVEFRALLAQSMAAVHAACGSEAEIDAATRTLLASLAYMASSVPRP